jgi:hypothetical protein
VNYILIAFADRSALSGLPHSAALFALNPLRVIEGAEKTK